ncbi:hypothetical protein Q4F19_16740 [Sphingomonas sp. BIUV-7]|uniref:Uncharacterized protein n=1 Tax=Sphingomonas natans TaxID=3063330 RepID=A0ABT8YEF3_9SPHN|nr:hypothetical protein [Sphingomonas sp. BIUV-7]MDO6416039.1 hypothetical protein [Sphingomonas sp. BIUV-7]
MKVAGYSLLGGGHRRLLSVKCDADDGAIFCHFLINRAYFAPRHETYQPGGAFWCQATDWLTLLSDNLNDEPVVIGLWLRDKHHGFARPASYCGANTLWRVPVGMAGPNYGEAEMVHSRSHAPDSAKNS